LLRWSCDGGPGGEDTAGEGVPSDPPGDAIEAIGTSGTHCAARLAAVHLGHSRRHDSVRGTVLDLQRALLAEPGRPHPNPGLATRHLPAGAALWWAGTGSGPCGCTSAGPCWSGAT
jgi:hypothetical protein